jgi:glucans biosynthesis protein
MHWQMPGELPNDVGWVVQSRRGRGHAKQSDGDLNYVVDFDGPALRALKPTAELNPVVEVGTNAELKEQNLFHNPVTGAWRMTVRAKRLDATKPVELRAFVKSPKGPVTETWSYIVPPELEKK